MYSLTSPEGVCVNTKRPSQLAITWGLTKYALRASIRNKGSLVFGLLFPIAFILVFGFFSNASSKISIGIDGTLNKNTTIYQTLAKIAGEPNSPIELEEGSAADLEKKVGDSKLDGALENPATDTTVTIVTSNGNIQGAGAVQSFMSGLLSQMNLKAAGVTTPVYTTTSKEVSGRSYRYIDYILPGQIGFSLLSLATFGVAFSFITLRRTLVLKRLFATSVNPLSFVLSQALSRSVIAIAQALIILLTGIKAFQFSLAHGWITGVYMMLLAAFGVLSFLGFGILIANIARDEQSAPLAINLFNLPQMLLAGVFFPTDTLPLWIQKIGNNLPLAYLNNAMRKIAIEGAGIKEVYPYLLGLVAWSAIAYYLAARTFKEE